MPASGSHRIGLMCASLAVGPLYLTAYAAGSAIDSIPQPIVIGIPDVVRFLLRLVPGVIGGFFIAVIPLGFAILVLSGLASSSRLAQQPFSWTVAGAAAGGLIAWGAGSDEFGEFFATLFSSAASLRLARAYLAWSPPRPLFLTSAHLNQERGAEDGSA